MIALGGILAAGSLVLLLLASVLPVWRTGVTALSGLFPMVGVLAAGRITGYLCWFAAGMLGLMLLPDKGVALLYLLLLGLYPVLKERIESIRKLSIEWTVKLIYFNAALTILWWFFRAIVLPQPPVWLNNSSALLYAVGNIVFVCYDFLLSRMVALLRGRLGLK